MRSRSVRGGQWVDPNVSGKPWLNFRRGTADCQAALLNASAPANRGHSRYPQVRTVTTRAYAIRRAVAGRFRHRMSTVILRSRWQALGVPAPPRRPAVR